ncbi:MAG: hydrogen peroxide-inducible genes activator [Nevskiaceae bacterium]|nr:MAG: hydrogen peroxide-inducible genes activator [Nevskiaceae bacterium]TBR72628.1 MAG: hydrogen peroxide-inducible genes activator [Nevskiaceae bacterium]
MTLTQLRYLVNLDKERHFSRAAERSFVSQPTLSVALKKLETELGVTLFERIRGEARPTPVGERIVAQARHVLAQARHLEELAGAGRDERAGPLRIGAIYTVGPYLLPALVPVLVEQAPQMPLVIEENFTAQLLEQLATNDLDVVIVALPVDTHGLSAWALYDEEFVILLPPHHPWIGRPAVPARSLAGESLLLLGPGHCFRDQVIEACPKCIDPDTATHPHTGSSLETIRYMVASGLGVTVLPRSSIENQPHASSPPPWVPFTPPAPHRRIAMVWRSTFPRRAAIQALHDGILACGMAGVAFLPQEKPT